MMYITFQQLYKGKGEDSSQRLQSSAEDLERFVGSEGHQKTQSVYWTPICC